MRALLVAVAVIGVAAAGGAGTGSGAPKQTWIGSFRLPARAEAVAVSVEITAGSANVALGAGHAGLQTVRVSEGGGRMRFALAGRPWPLVFTGQVRGGTLAGSVSQGPMRGSFRLVAGDGGRVLPLLGLYRGAAGAVAVVKAEGYPPWLIELPSGDVHGVGPRFTVGRRLGDTSGDGVIGLSAGALTWHATTYTRVRLRQEEVRFGLLAGTLTLPPGRGPFPAVAMVHGSGPLSRSHEQAFEAFAALQGLAVLAYDKRGIGQSQGVYPGERATSSTIDVLARDAVAAVRFLRAQPEVDRRRVGLLGDSQAGWIVPLAAAREPGIRWALLLAGPVLSVGEVDYWAALAGQGESPPQGSFADMEADVKKAGPSGFDPAPYLRRLTIPALWIYGDDDRTVPTDLCVERLRSLQVGHDFTWAVVKTNHTLFDIPSGLNRDLRRTRGFAAGLYTTMRDWLRLKGIAS